MTLIYCQRWNNRFNKPIKPLTVEEAQRLHEAGEPYAVASFDDMAGRADRAVEIALRSSSARTYFFDDYDRVEMIYIFTAHESGLFLSEITTYDYGDSVEHLGMSQCVRMETDEYNPDGTGLHSVEDESTGEDYSQELTLKPDRDLQRHIELIPGFGEYASLARAARDEAPLPFD